MGYSMPKRCSTQREEPRLQEAGQVMQETEYPVPLERLAGSMPSQSLRKPPALPGGLTQYGTKRATDIGLSGLESVYQSGGAGDAGEAKWHAWRHAAGPAEGL